MYLVFCATTTSGDCVASVEDPHSNFVRFDENQISQHINTPNYVYSNI